MQTRQDLMLVSRSRAWMVVSEAEGIARRSAGEEPYSLPAGLGRLVCGAAMWLADGQQLSVELANGFPAVPMIW